MASRSHKLPNLVTAHKKKKTFVLSSDVVDYIEAEKRDRHSVSASSVLEQMIREHRHKYQAKKVSAAITSYYDSLSDEERNESELWGQFSETQFSLE